jgi:N-terminal domain on NACHT_NTPase and P-loop NTPases
MSGAEAILILGVISSIIAIVDGTKQVYDGVKDAQGLPDAFREVTSRLPIVHNILGSAKRHIEEGHVDEDSCKGVKPVVNACERKAQKLDELFRNVIPADGATDLKRYYKAVKAYGKGNEVEKLMRGILEDVELLSCEHGMKTATKTQQQQLIKAITEISAVVPSAPKQECQEPGITANYSGSGAQYIAQGENIAQGDVRQYISGGGSMHFGKD